jgi:hypothetical protein
MPDWVPLRDAILRDDPNGQRLVRIEAIESWLGLGQEGALAACRGPTASEAAARETDSMMQLVMAAQRRDLAIPDGPGFAPRFQELIAAYQAGTMPQDQRALFERNAMAAWLMGDLRARFPAIAAPPPPSSQAEQLHTALLALQARQTEAQQYAVPGMVTPERMAALDAILAEYRALLDGLAADDPGAADVCFFAAHAATALGRGWQLLGRVGLAAERIAEASRLFARAGLAQEAADAAERARSLGYAVLADIDGASVSDLRALLAAGGDHMTRARAHARLARLAADANDVFDAGDMAELAAADLAAAGFADPRSGGIDAVFDGWIGTAVRTQTGAPPVRLLNEVGQSYQAILGAAHACLVVPDPPGAARIEAVLAALNATLLEAVAQVSVVRGRVLAGLRRYMPLLAEEYEPPPADHAALAENAALLQRLNGIQTDANAAEAAGDPGGFADLLRRAAEGVAEADKGGVLPTIGMARYIDAYVRLRAGDAAGAIDATSRGETLLLAGVAASPEVWAGHPQFGPMLMLRRLRVEALGALGDTAGLRACADDTVRLIEAQRARVSDPYQQGAFLADRTLFYEMAAFTAFKQGDWDGLLSAMELIKSRAALLNRLAPPPQADDADLSARLDAATDALATAPRDSAAFRAASEQRRLLLSLRAILRMQAASPGSVPVLSIAAVQGVLAPDEAAIAWVWVAPGVLVVLALDAARVQAERVLLAEADRTLLAAYVAAVRTGRVRMAALDDTVSRLVAAVLPEATRRFVAGARRLILSPHRALHLLPFHAAWLAGRFMIEDFAIRTVPNLGSLLAPWHGGGGGGGVLAIGVDRFAVPGIVLPALHAAEAEAGAVASAWEKRGTAAMALTGPAATRAAMHDLGEGLAKFRCIHLATHGSSVFAKEAENDPFASRLFLYDAGLDALAIGRLRLGAEVVVLSACHSGQRALGGRGLAELPGDDVFGLQAALFEAGARSVIGALWPVHDASAPLIVPALHAGLAAGLPPETALQRAILGYLARPEAARGIYFWAPLFLSSIGRMTQQGETG